MAEPQLAPRRYEEEEEHLGLDLTSPLRDRSEDSDSYEDEWDDEEKEEDEYNSEEEEEEEYEEEKEEEVEEEQNKVNEKSKEEEESKSVEIESFQQKDLLEDKSRDEVADVKKFTDITTEYKYKDVYTEKDSKYRDLGEDYLRYLEQRKDTIKHKDAFSKDLVVETSDIKFKEKRKRLDTRHEVREIYHEQHEVKLRPGIPFRNPQHEERLHVATQPERQFSPIPKPIEKPIIDEDDYLSELEESEAEYRDPEELPAIPEVGSEQWKVLMEQIIYKNPYEGYVPEEHPDPSEAYWRRIDRIDYQEGRWEDDLFEEGDPWAEPTETMKEYKELIARFRRGDKPL